MTPPSRFKAYDVDYRITEIYDRVETQSEDVRLLRELIAGKGRLKILEPFCGNGRILIPLAQDGHEIVGRDKSPPMLVSARHKIGELPEAVRKNITLEQGDVLAGAWPEGFDLVVLGGNCLYELATPEEQERCIRCARYSLKPGGWLYLDNDHMEGELSPEWYAPGIEECFPTGLCADGTDVRGSRETVWYNVTRRLVRFRRTVELTSPAGKSIKKEWLEQKHPPGTAEMKAWLRKYGFEILSLWGDREKSPYSDTSERAVFWARLIEK